MPRIVWGGVAGSARWRRASGRISSFTIAEIIEKLLIFMGLSTRSGCISEGGCVKLKLTLPRTFIPQNERTTMHLSLKSRSFYLFVALAFAGLQAARGQSLTIASG